LNSLFPYQNEGAAFLAERKLALLADEMGLGKTVQAIHGLERIHAKRAIVISPSVARINWVREFEMWSKSKPDVFSTTNLADPVPQNGHVVCSFEYATKNFRRICEHKWDVLIVDEAHFLKSTDTHRAKAILGVEGVIRKASRCWLLSGTPAPSHAGELWLILYTFGVTKLTQDDFVNRYCVLAPFRAGNRTVNRVVATRKEMIPELRQLLFKVMLRRLKKDVMKELPPINFGHVVVEPGLVDIEILPSFTQYFLPTDRRAELNAELKRQSDLLISVEANMKPNLNDKVTTVAAIQDSVSTLRRYVGLQKCEAAIELISKELKSNAYQKIVIFAIHRDVIETMRVGLREFGAVCLYGNTDPAKRQKNIDRFQNNPKCRVFIGNIMAAGTAITLTAAHHVTFIEQDWVPGNNAQAIMRVHRIGQEQPVSVRFILLDQSLDAKIGFIVKRKTEALTQIFD
jgi:SNF2 family DNA or RNA helicase